MQHVAALALIHRSKSETQGQLSRCGGVIRPYLGLLHLGLAGQLPCPKRNKQNPHDKMCEEQVFFVENACTFSGQDFKETLSLRSKDRGGDLKRKGQGGGGGDGGRDVR